eukprot:scaffold83085_cov24-Tisochrysis_lutea.AAC.6
MVETGGREGALRASAQHAVQLAAGVRVDAAERVGARLGDTDVLHRRMHGHRSHRLPRERAQVRLLIRVDVVKMHARPGGKHDGCSLRRMGSWRSSGSGMTSLVARAPPPSPALLRCARAGEAERGVDRAQGGWETSVGADTQLIRVVEVVLRQPLLRHPRREGRCRGVGGVGGR